MLSRTLASEDSLVLAWYSFQSRVSQLSSIAEHRRKADLPLLGYDAECRLIDSLSGRMASLLDCHYPSPHQLLSTLQDVQSYLRSSGTFADHCQRLWSRVYDDAPSRATPYEAAVYDRLAVRSTLARRAEKVYRMCSGFDEYFRAGWYPFFLTLTVRNSDLDLVFSPDSRAWAKFIRSVARQVSRSPNAPLDAPDASQVKFVRSSERSPRLERPHIHAVLWLRDLPAGLTDPNRGRSVPSCANSLWFLRYWPYADRRAYSAVPLRFSPNDAFARRGWQWRVDKVADGSYVPQAAGSPVVLARYMSKYLTKDHGRRTSDRRILRWQMSLSLGMTEVLNLVNRVSLETAEHYLTRIAETEWTHLGNRVPPGLIRRLAARRVIRDRTADLLSSDPSAAGKAMTYLRTMLATSTRPGILNSLDEMQRQARQTTRTVYPDGQSTGFSPTLNLIPLEDFDVSLVDEANRVACDCFRAGIAERGIRGNPHPLH